MVLLLSLSLCMRNITISQGYTFQHCYTTFVDLTMLAPEAPMFVRHFLLDERLRANQAFVQQKNVGQTWVLNVLTLSDQQILYNNVGTFSPGVRYILNVFFVVVVNVVQIKEELLYCMACLSRRNLF